MTLLRRLSIFRDKPDFQAGVGIHSGLHSACQRIGIGVGKAVNRRNVVLCRIPVDLPLDIQAPLVLAQRIPFAPLMDAQSDVRPVAAVVDQGGNTACRWRLHDVRHPYTGVMPALQSRGKAHGQKRRHPKRHQVIGYAKVRLPQHLRRKVQHLLFRR